MNAIPKSTSIKTVKRRFVSMRFKVPEQGFYIREQLKIPYGNCKIVGVFTTSRVLEEKEPCQDTQTQFVYYGISNTPMKDHSFLNNSKVLPYTGEYPEDTLFTGQQGKWWYYAHPVLDQGSNPNLIENGDYIENIRTKNPPVSLSITPKGECTPRPYLLWSEPLTKEADGEVLITFGEYS